MPSGPQMRWMMGITGQVIRATCLLSLVLGVVATIYLTDRRSSDLETIEWLPGSLHGIAHWADYHGRFRNVPAYGLLSLPLLLLCTTPRRRGKAVVALAVFATAMEYTQLFIPTRFFDWYDIIESWLGIVIVWFLVEIAFAATAIAHRLTERKNPSPLSSARHKPANSPRRLPIPRPAND